MRLMDKLTLLFWSVGPDVSLSEAEIARELMYGEDVEGLIDLPVREILDRLKSEFPDHRESAGHLTARVGGGSLEATWTWQFVRVDCRDLPPADRERLTEILESFNCTVYEPGNDR